MTDRKMRQMRAKTPGFKTRAAEDGNLYIEGYFSVFNTIYELWGGDTESVAPGAFANTLGDDIRALIDHDSRLVIGRNKAGTLELREDERGLWGRILINPKDQDAVNCYERVARGDVNQCSFGFDILREESEVHADGSIHWTIREVKLYEVSVVTFPAYEDTAVEARKKDREVLEKRAAESWRIKMTKKLKGDA